tara:strand:+ start:69 stop:257 length:189 start_codon:yes stop_codon:yes gene_type:complete
MWILLMAQTIRKCPEQVVADMILSTIFGITSLETINQRCQGVQIEEWNSKDTVVTSNITTNL